MRIGLDIASIAYRPPTPQDAGHPEQEPGGAKCTPTTAQPCGHDPYPRERVRMVGTCASARARRLRWRAALATGSVGLAPAQARGAATNP